MQFVNDHELSRCQVSGISFLSEKNGETLWRGDEELGWMLAKFQSLIRGRVAGAEVNANILIQAHPHDWRPQIFLDVVGEGA